MSPRRIGAWSVLAGTLLLGACLEPPRFACTNNDACVFEGVQGMCDFPTNTCVYPADGECPSGFKDAEGSCVDVAGTVSSGDVSSSSTSTTDDSTTTTSTVTSTSTSTTQGAESETEAQSTTTTTTTTSMTMSDTSSSDSGSECEGALENLTGLGTVGASSVFSSQFLPSMSVDGDLTTSWFSTGPEPADAPSLFTWNTGQERCISTVVVENNMLHANPDFRLEYGFGSVLVRFYTDDSSVAYEEMVDLAGSPDPRVVVNTGDVLASRVVLEFAGHENDGCGGFSELQVLGNN